MDFTQYIDVIREKLDDYRYNHSLCVAEEAQRLAVLYGENEADAYLAGLLHDITKNYSHNEHLLIFDMFDIILTDVEKSSCKLWHGISGAAYVNNVLKIDNNNIVSAIRYHTTAKRGMSLFEKLIYLADFTSKDRKYPDVDIMRRLVNTNIDEAMLYSLRHTINDLLIKNVAVHPDTLGAYNETIIKLNGESNEV